MKQLINVCIFNRCHLNIAGIESFPNIQDYLPRCWSEPALGNILRHNLEPPLLQQAAFDDTVRLILFNFNIIINGSNVIVFSKEK